MSDLYREIIIEESNYPHNYGRLEGADVSSHHLNPSCGDEVTVYLKLSDDKQTIIDVKWEGQGCAISKAAMSVLSEELKGMSIADAKKLTKNELEDWLGLDVIAVNREKCLLTGLTSTHKALHRK